MCNIGNRMHGCDLGRHNSADYEDYKPSAVVDQRALKCFHLQHQAVAIMLCHQPRAPFHSHVAYAHHVGDWSATHEDADQSSENEGSGSLLTIMPAAARTTNNVELSVMPTLWDMVQQGRQLPALSD